MTVMLCDTSAGFTADEVWDVVIDSGAPLEVVAREWRMSVLRLRRVLDGVVRVTSAEADRIDATRRRVEVSHRR